MPSNKNNRQKIVRQHGFAGVKDALLTPAPGALGTAAYTISTDSGGNSNNAWVFAPLGLLGVTLSGTTFASGTSGNILAPTLRTLYNRALDFQWYRVTRAKVIFVGNTGSTVTGIITMSGYADPSDASLVTFSQYVSGPNTKSFDLASATTRDPAINVPVDSSWKKVSGNLTVPGNTYPYNSGAATSFVPVNTASDLAFGSFSYYVAGYSSGGVNTSTNIGTFYLDYDVEFKGPIDSAINR